MIKTKKQRADERDIVMKAAIAVLHSLGPVPRDDLLGLVDGLTHSTIRIMENNDYLKLVHRAEGGELLEVTNTGRWLAGLERDMRSMTPGRLHHPSGHYDGKVSWTNDRPGSAAALALPSRAFDGMHYPGVRP